MCQEMIIWQITAGAQHNSFADTIGVEPLLKKTPMYEATSKLFMKNTTLPTEGDRRLDGLHAVGFSSAGSAPFHVQLLPWHM